MYELIFITSTRTLHSVCSPNWRALELIALKMPRARIWYCPSKGVRVPAWLLC